MLMKRVSFVIVCFMAFVSLGCQNGTNGGENALPAGALGPLETVKFPLGGVEVEIEIAFYANEQEQGLMFRDSMPENHGMIFVYREPEYLNFWMKNTRIPLSIAFVREDLIIGNIEEMKAGPKQGDPSERYHSRYQSRYALEMNTGWFEKHGVKEGDRIALPLEAIERAIAQKAKK